ncbi:hypothetical protein [Microbacterium jejuense]|uniref:hypothetical protein n=1 Tax=Microbacterium jejuense TaxID=1263637 RepID=UPI0031EA0925
MSTPIRVRVRMYQVGFGDCFLISVEYDEPLADGRAERHLLIDYGTSHSPRKGFARGRMAEVAALIEQHTHGELDVLAVTHRHRDHLRGFEVDAGAAIMRKLAPKVVLRSWTEDPALAVDATGPGGGAALAGAAAAGAASADGAAAAAAADGAVGAASTAYAQSLARTQGHTARLAGLVGLDDDVRAAAEDQLKNAEAVALLDELSKDGRGRYLYAGADAGLAELIPGLTTTVLGPPTVDQDERVAKQAADDKEYWLAALDASLALTSATPEVELDGDARAAMPVGPGPVRWLVEHLQSQRTHSMLRLVRNLDDALNNTSLLLLFEFEKLKLLFPGDAQIENWQYTLDRLDDEPALRDRLATVDLYKVGHHGSRNATPRSLWGLWKERSDDLPKLTALMSTRRDVHGDAIDTAVPQDQLVMALHEVADVYSTDEPVSSEAFVELVAEVGVGGPFRPVPPPGR